MPRRIVGPTEAELIVRTFKEGLLAAAGHDLTLRAQRFECTIDDESVELEVDAASLVVVGGTLDSHDRAKIEATLRDEVLAVERHPTIAFRSTRVSERRVEGELTIKGVSRKIAIDIERDGPELVATYRVHQPDFGIKPYTAMLGALKVKPDVDVSFRVPSPR
jgi:polyisoprenoid-binding protein YceI